MAAIPAGTGIFDVDGTRHTLPNLLDSAEVARIEALMSAAPAPSYRIDSATSPDDRTVLASHKGERVFLDLRTGATVPVARPDKPAPAFSPYV